MSLPEILDEDKVIGLVRKRLLEVPEVQAFVAGRIVGGLGEHPDYGSLPKPAIALLVAGGRRTYAGVVGRFNVEVWALSSESQSEARRIYATAAAALQGEGLASEADATRGLATELGGRREGWFDAGQAWYSCGTWTLQVVRDR